MDSEASMKRGEEAMQISEMLRKGLSGALALLLVAPSMQNVQAQSMSVVDLNMTVGKSLVIDYPVEIGRISTSSPEVVDAVPATAKEFLLHGKGHGAATVVVWAKNGARTMYNVTVEHNTDPIKKLITETFPNEDIKIQSARDSITLIGRVSSKEVADRAVAIAAPMAKTVVSNLSVSAAPVEKQVVLKVKFAEVNRNRGAQFGVNLISTGAGNTPGRMTTGQFPAPQTTQVSGVIGGPLQGTTSEFTLSDALNIFAFRPDLNLGAVIRALQNEDVLQILAEPNLVTMNGKEASFLVGGEFPVPVLQGGGNAGAVTIQFREFGIRLTFNPQLTGNGTIRMYVKPEVSTIDLANAVQLSGFTIPALATRRMETNVELKLGQSFAVAGLIDDRVTDQMSRIPGLSSIPILGVLFKSRSDRKTKSELVVIVTPEVIEPLDPGQKLPMPEFPKEFLKQSDMKKSANDPSKSQDAKALNAKNATDVKDAAKAQETGVWKNMMFWRSGKKTTSLRVEPKSTESLAATGSPASSPASSSATSPVTSSASASALSSAPAPSESPAFAVSDARSNEVGKSPAPSAGQSSENGRETETSVKPQTNAVGASPAAEAALRPVAGSPVRVIEDSTASQPTATGLRVASQAAPSQRGTDTGAPASPVAVPLALRPSTISRNGSLSSLSAIPELVPGSGGQLF
jgi:pilus assembly protein CpaC